ncbi:hypothetical protein H1R20_g9851, partial [Candolleomyces eurysporus]
MRTSPRKKAASPKQVINATPTKRKARQCRRCPGKPLLSECEHSHKKTDPALHLNGSGSEFQLRTVTAPFQFPYQASASFVHQAPPAANAASDSNPAFHAYASSVGTVGYAQGTQLDSYAMNASSGAFQAPGFMFNPIYRQPFLPGGLPHSTEPQEVPSHSGQRLTHPTCPPPLSTLPIDPSLVAQSHGQSPPGILPPQPATTPPLATEEALDDSKIAEYSSEDSEDSDGEAENPNESSPPTKKKRVYASDKNPHHGYIEGVGRGNRMIKMARKRKLKVVYTDQHTSSMNWRRLTRDFMTRAEDVANRTASWLYVAIHNPAASQPFTHFASRRLRLEAPDDLQKIHQQVASLMTILKRADRSHSLQSEKEKEKVLQQMQEATDKAEKAMEQAAKAESEAQRLREELDARNKVLYDLYMSAQAAQSQSDHVVQKFGNQVALRETV